MYFYSVYIIPLDFAKFVTAFNMQVEKQFLELANRTTLASIRPSAL